MEEKTKYAAVVLALLAGFALFCAWRFSAQLSAAQPWQVNAAQAPAPEEGQSPEASEEAGSYPESLLPGEVININTADVYDLQRLPGIGESRALSIIAWREENGFFQSVDQLEEIYGIGPKILDGLRDYAAVK